MYAASDSQRIRDAVSVRDVIAKYHTLGDSRGRTTCPLHGGTHDNLGYDDKRWHCFVCGAKGDAIGFVMQLYGVDFKAAINKIARDFGVRLVDSKTDPREAHKLALQDIAKKKEQLKLKQKHSTLKSLYWQAFDLYVEYDKNMRDYAPKSPDEPLNPLFVEALQEIGYSKYILSEVEERLNEFERINGNT